MENTTEANRTEEQKRDEGEKKATERGRGEETERGDADRGNRQGMKAFFLRVMRMYSHHTLLTQDS